MSQEKHVATRTRTRMAKVELRPTKVNSIIVEATMSEELEKAAQQITKLLAKTARRSRYDAVMLAAVAKMYLSNMLAIDQLEVDKTIIMLEKRTPAPGTPTN